MSSLSTTSQRALSLSGLHRLPPARRRALVAALTRLEGLQRLLSLPKDGVGDLMVENYVGFVGLPVGVAANFLIDGESCLLPLATEQPSVVAAASSAAKFIREHGGFRTQSAGNNVIGQVQLTSVDQSFLGRFEERKDRVWRQCEGLLIRMRERGGGLVDLRARQLSPVMVVVELVVDVCEAMGANVVNQACEGLGRFLEQQFEGARRGLCVLSNLSTERLVGASFEVPVQALRWKGVDFTNLLLEAYQFAQLDPHRATTHNKGIMNGIDGFLAAMGQDWRAVEAGAHAYAARSGRYQPLSHYRVVEREGVRVLRGEIQLPMSAGSVGGALGKNPVYGTCFGIAGRPSSRRLGELAAALGLAQNFSALRAMVVEGIQKGHMRLHSREQATL